MVQAVRYLDAVGVQTDGLALRRPSLADVFLALTGHAAEEEPEAAAGAEDRRRGRAPQRSARGGGAGAAER